MQYLSVSDVAREIGAVPRDISDLFYRRILDDTVCPIVAGTQLIPRSYVSTVRETLIERGKLAAPTEPISA